MQPLKFYCVPILGLLAVAVLALPTRLPAAESFRDLIEADWLKQAEAWTANPPGTSGPAGSVSTAADAAGAVDGVKDGKYAFHTNQELNPWWQVDLGQATAVARIVVYNRLDYAPGLHNADNLVVLSSDDGRTWTPRHENRGQHFGGVSGAKPLEVTFPAGQLRTRFVRLQIPSQKPIYFHLDEVEIFGPADPKKNLALGKTADQSSVSVWSTAKRYVDPNRPVTYPTQEILERARRLAADLRRAGVDTQRPERELDAIEAQCAQSAPSATAESNRALYLKARWAMRRLALSNPALNFDQLLFVKRFTQETYPDVCLNHMPWVSRPGGDLCILSGWKAESEPTVRTLIGGALGPGHVHGMDLWWDASRVVFGYAKAKSMEPVKGFPGRLGHDARLAHEPIHLFEIGIDGKGLRQLTDHRSWSDLDPTYCPNGDIVFVSERCGTALQCNEYDKDETSCNLYVMRPNGEGIRRLSANKDGDYAPHALDDGTIAYTRWEYHERNLMENQSLWTIRPDGTGADALFKQHLPTPLALYDARSIPGTSQVVAVAGGHHTLYCGPVVVVDRRMGMNDPRGLRIVTPGVRPPEGGMSGTAVAEGGTVDRGGFYMNPWALSDKHFLVAYSYSPEQTEPAGYALYLIDVYGTKELIYRDPAISCSMPIPLQPRPRPPVLPDTTDPAAETATCTVSNVAHGVEGIAPERIRHLRIAEILAWPYEIQTGGHRYGEHHGGVPQLPNWTPVRILGDVPVQRDGSAQFTVPVDRMIYFQLLDENRMELRRMRSFISFQPGEQRSCIGCHETRLTTGAAASTDAAVHGPATLLPPPWGARTLSFLRDVQPVLDRHCVECHGGLKPAGGLDFIGGLTSHHKDIPGYGWNRAYETMRAKGLVSTSSVNADLSVTPPLAFGSHKSQLIDVLRNGPCGRRAKLSPDDWLRLVMWIDANAPYHDGFVNKRPAVPPYDLAADQGLLRQITAVHQRRCAECHNPGELSRLDWIDIHHPADSLFLKAPLAAKAGGSAKCRPAVGYKDQNDPDYKALAEAVQQAVKKAWDFPRRDVQALVVEREENRSPQKLAKGNGESRRE